MKLTLDGMIRALRGRLHDTAEGLENGDLSARDHGVDGRPSALDPATRKERRDGLGRD